MAEAFKESADRIIAGCADDRRHPDRFFYPVAYLYRHYLELQLKLIIELGQEIPGLPASSTKGFGHSLRGLWQDALVVPHEVFADSDPAALNPIEHVIMELDAVDPDGQSFRYYRNRKGQINLQALPRVLSLEHLQIEMDSVFGFLSRCEAGVSNAVDYIHEMRSDYGEG